MFLCNIILIFVRTFWLNRDFVWFERLYSVFKAELILNIIGEPQGFYSRAVDHFSTFAQNFLHTG